MKVSTKFEVDTTIRCLVIALLLLIRYVTVTFDLLTLVSGHTWRVTWSIPQKNNLIRVPFMSEWHICLILFRSN